MTSIDCFLSRPSSRIPAAECGNWKVMSQEVCPLPFVCPSLSSFSHFLCSHPPPPISRSLPPACPLPLGLGVYLSGILSLVLGCGSVRRNFFWLVSLASSLLTFLRLGTLKLSLGIPCVIYELTSPRGSYPLRIGQRFLRQVSMVLHLKSCLLEIDVSVE